MRGGRTVAACTLGGARIPLRRRGCCQCDATTARCNGSECLRGACLVMIQRRNGWRSQCHSRWQSSNCGRHGCAARGIEACVIPSLFRQSLVVCLETLVLMLVVCGWLGIDSDVVQMQVPPGVFATSRDMRRKWSSAATGARFDNVALSFLLVRHSSMTSRSCPQRTAGGEPNDARDQVKARRAAPLYGAHWCLGCTVVCGQCQCLDSRLADKDSCRLHGGKPVAGIGRAC